MTADFENKPFEELRLDEPRQLYRLAYERPADYTYGDHLVGTLYCPRCGANRRMRVEELYTPPTPTFMPGVPRSPLTFEAHFAPALFRYQCLQCAAVFTSAAYESDSGSGLVVLAASGGGLTSPNTPKPVAYFLDQAYRARAIGANSAAVAMFRSAVEHLLHDQGYHMRMLGPKIGAVEADKKAGGGPPWVRDLDPAFIKVLGQLGNSAIHPDDKGDITKQDALDHELLLHVEATITELLDLVYEAPVRTKARLAALQATAATFKK